jgi:anti-sigma factor RsiW
MECRDVREMADSFLGEELLAETNHEILRHMETCPACRADLAARRALRAAVKRAFHNTRDLDPSPEFMANLGTTLRDAAHTVRAPRGIRFQRWLTIAATVLLAIALGFAYRGVGWITATDALARAAVGDHRNCALQFRLAEKPISLEEAAQRYGAPYRVLESLPPNDVTTVVGPAHVLERHACVYDGRRFAHVVLEYGGTHVSLLVTARDDGARITVPDEARPTLNEGRVDSMSVVSVQASRYMIFLVGDLAQPDLARLADALAGPLSRQLAGV